MPDSRSLNFAGDVDDEGQFLPMSVDNLRGRTERGHAQRRTPENVAAQLARSRELFVDGYYTFTDAATRSLQAVEAALRVRFAADGKVPFAKNIGGEELALIPLVTSSTVVADCRTNRDIRLVRAGDGVVSNALDEQKVIIHVAQPHGSEVFDEVIDERTMR